MSKFKPNPRSSPPSLARRSTYSRQTAAAGGAVLTPEAPVPESPDLRTEQAEPSTNGVQRMGFNCLLIFLFFKFSFFHEWLDMKAHADLHLIIVVSSLTLLAAIGSGRLADAFSDKIIWMWMGFILFMSLATITSTWPGGSFAELTSYIRTAFPVIFILPALTATKKNMGRLLGAIGVACVVAVGLGFSNSEFTSGRMNINENNVGELTNSNDYAAFLIIMLPALVYLTMRPGRSALVKTFGVVIIGLSMYEILSTGSRGGLVAVGLMLLFVAFTSTNKIRIGILVGVPVLAMAAIPFVPQESVDRLKTLFGSDVAKGGEAVESKEARLELLKESWRLTLEHPLTGIGPDQFMVKQADEAKQQGQRGMWHVTHNTYTQISCECGIPAALLFVGAAITSFGRFLRLRKHPDKEIALIAGTAAVMMVGYCTCIFFLSMGYAIQMLVMSALAITATKLGRKDGSVPVEGRVLAA